MFKDLFINATILISFLVLGHQFFFKYLTKVTSPILSKILYGSMFGVLGIILMQFAIHITDTLLLDLKFVVIVLSALFGGPISSIVSSLIMASFRILLFGV